MIDNRSIDELVSKLSDVLPDSLKTLKSDLDNNLRAVIESSFRKMNLVSREEFDVQTALLERTQLKLKQLEQQLDALEKKT